LLVESIAGPNPYSVLDLGSGSGTLSRAAVSRWNPHEIITVDLDESAATETELNLLGLQPTLNHRHILADAFLCLDRLAGIRAASLDIVISNPPYRAATRSDEIDSIIERCGFSVRSITRTTTVPADVLFLAQAIHLVKPGGRIGLIVPDGLISGLHMREFREKLLHDHAIERVIQLPRRAFRGTDAQTFILVAARGRSSDLIRLDAIDLTGRWGEPRFIDAAMAVDRMDHAYHCRVASSPSEGLATLRELGASIKRGRISSVQLANESHPTLHTNGFPTLPGGGLVLPRQEREQDLAAGIWAEAGDIVMARVDRRLEHKVALVIDGAAILSDCVLRIRCPKEYRSRILESLSSARGRADIAAHARGTGPRHISAGSVLSLRA
jgi:type I restriction enzyme M protein